MGFESVDGRAGQVGDAGSDGPAWALRDAAPKASDFAMRRMDSSPIPARFVRPHRHEAHEIIIVRSGYSHHVVDGQAVDLGAGSICFLPRGHMHRLETESGVVGWLVQFSDAFLPADVVSRRWNYLRALTDGAGARRALHLQPSELGRVEAMMELMELEYSTPSALQEQSLRHWLSLLLLHIGHLNRQLPPPGGHIPSDLDLFRRFSDILEQDFARHHDVGHYAAGLDTSAVNLSRAVANIVGKPTKKIIEDRVVLEAKRMLMYGDRSVKEIALALGYADQFHFSKRFKRLVGMTPTGFRSTTRSGPL